MSSFKQKLAALVAMGPAFLTASGVSAQTGPTVRIDPKDTVYTNRPGNEFSMVFTSRAAPQGVSISIDPDDMVPVTIVQQGKPDKRVLVPRWSFIERINGNLPVVPGGMTTAQLEAMNKDENKKHSIESKTVMSHYLHVVCDHGVPLALLDEAMRKSHPAFGLPVPAPSPLVNPCSAPK